MKNKKGQAQNNELLNKITLFVIAFILAGFLVYLLGKVALGVGIFGLIMSIIILLIAGHEKSEQGVKMGLFILFISIGLIIIGLIVVNFFEANEVGRIWLNSGKTIVNTTAETYKTTKELLP